MAMIYEDSKDLHVKAVLIYVDSTKAYKDADKTEQFTASELKDAFLRGSLIVTGNGYTVPTVFAMTGDTASVTAGEGTYSSKADT